MHEATVRARGDRRVWPTCGGRLGHQRSRIACLHVRGQRCPYKRLHHACEGHPVIGDCATTSTEREVGQVRLSVTDHHAGGLDHAMDEPDGMRGIERTGHVSEQLHGDRASLDIEIGVGERCAGDEPVATKSPCSRRPAAMTVAM